MDTRVETRICSTCGVEQPLEDYYRHAKAPDGRMASCKKCRKTRQRAYQAARQDDLRIRHDDAFYEAAINDTDLLKRCWSCKETKHISGFNKHRSRYDGFNDTCKSCRAAKEKGQKRKPSQNRRRRLANYGLTLDQYAMLLDSQGGVCAICAEPPSDKENLGVDHCHKGGHVRGLLCRSCNAALGLMKDDARIANKAVEYLLRF